MKLYRNAPLPFQGQKRRFLPTFIRTLSKFQDKTVFVDLFGGSGLLSHATKCMRPDATVVYNDFDNYSERLAHSPQTNALLADIRSIIGNNVKSRERIVGNAREAILQRIRSEDTNAGYVDYITLSSNLLYPPKYKTDYDGLAKQSLYNRVTQSEYSTSEDYLEGLKVVSCDYRELYAKFKGNPNVVYLIDPPYMSTDTSTYGKDWKLADYLDVLDILDEDSFVYFSSSKSSIIELCEWLKTRSLRTNPFDCCEQHSIVMRNNYHSQYQDIMYIKS